MSNIDNNIKPKQRLPIKTAVILFVDDVEEMHKPLKIMLNKAGIQMISAYDGEQAIKILDNPGEFEIGVLMTDQRMPIKNGMELLRHANLHHPHIIKGTTTAYSDTKPEDMLNETGISFYFEKPWDISQVISTLKRELGNYFRHKEVRTNNADFERMGFLEDIDFFTTALISMGTFSHFNNTESATRDAITDIFSMIPWNLSKDLGYDQSIDASETLKSVSEISSIIKNTPKHSEISGEISDLLPVDLDKITEGSRSRVAQVVFLIKNIIRSYKIETTLSPSTVDIEISGKVSPAFLTGLIVSGDNKKLSNAWGIVLCIFWLIRDLGGSVRMSVNGFSIELYDTPPISYAVDHSAWLEDIRGAASVIKAA